AAAPRKHRTVYRKSSAVYSWVRVIAFKQALLPVEMFPDQLHFLRRHHASEHPELQLTCGRPSHAGAVRIDGCVRHAVLQGFGVANSYGRIRQTIGSIRSVHDVTVNFIRSACWRRADRFGVAGEIAPKGAVRIG